VDEGYSINIGFTAVMADAKKIGSMSLSAIIGLDVIRFGFLLLT
jgi:hypothetical protein